MEPVVIFLSVHQAVIYATLYMCFPTFPTVFQEERGWSAGIGGLAVFGITVGIIATTLYDIWADNRYARLSDQHHGYASPESRLPLCMVGAVSASVGLVWISPTVIKLSIILDSKGLLCTAW